MLHAHLVVAGRNSQVSGRTVQSVPKHSKCGSYASALQTGKMGTLGRSGYPRNSVSTDTFTPAHVQTTPCLPSPVNSSLQKITSLASQWKTSCQSHGR